MKRSEQVAMITGASAGIGRETARSLAAIGIRVVLAARRKERLDHLAAELQNKGGKALPVVADVSREPDVDNLFREALDHYGRIDYLINNAGSGLYSSVEDTTPEQMERIWRNNFMSTFYCIRNVIPVMKRQKSGHILTVSSMAGMRGTPMNGAYCATKFAQIGLMDSLRRELKGIHCTIVLPGPTKTEFIERTENPSRSDVRHKGWIQDPADVANAIVHAIEKPSARVVTQKFGRTLLLFNAFSPGLTDWLVESSLTQRRKGAKKR
jgi:short-subunit dehydrogenase